MKRTGMLVLLIALLSAAPVMAGEGEKTGATTQAETQNLDDLVQQKLIEFYEWANANRANYNEEKHAEFARELLGDIDISMLRAEHLEKLLYIVRPADDLRNQVAKRAEILSREKTVEGVRAAVISMQLAGMQDKGEVSEHLRVILRHPALDEALKSELAGQMLQGLGYLDAEMIEPVANELLELGDRAFKLLPKKQAGSMLGYFEAISGLEETLGKEKVEKLRKRTVAFMQSAVDEVGESDARLTKYLERNLAYLDGAAARGELIGHTAPEIKFIWAKGPNEVTSLADLKGKVVVLDFWATWCGPCIASFPELRKLTQYYEGYDVAIVGLTSPQGFHVNPDDHQRIDCTDDRAKELSLMPGFMEKKDINWTIAFSETDVFNPDFGVRGIPHVAVIDAEGKVRHNGLHPMGTPMAEKVAMINKLLKEAGKPAPPPIED
jgi:thiol-disulfide isomerase/thioredoxin